MEIKKVFEIIENNIEESDFSGPIENDKITIAEEILKVNLPKSYSAFLEKYGAGDISGIEIYGIIKDPKIDAEMIPNGIWLTLNLRKENNLPDKFVVISETGYGSYYVIDTSITNSNEESPILLWDINAKEKIADSFDEFLLKLLQETFE